MVRRRMLTRARSLKALGVDKEGRRNILSITPSLKSLLRKAPRSCQTDCLKAISMVQELRQNRHQLDRKNFREIYDKSRPFEQERALTNHISAVRKRYGARAVQPVLEYAASFGSVAALTALLSAKDIKLKKRVLVNSIKSNPDAVPLIASLKGRKLALSVARPLARAGNDRAIAGIVKIAKPNELWGITRLVAKDPSTFALHFFGINNRIRRTKAKEAAGTLLETIVRDMPTNPDQVGEVFFFPQQLEEALNEAIQTYRLLDGRNRALISKAVAIRKALPAIMAEYDAMPLST